MPAGGWMKAPIWASARHDGGPAEGAGFGWLAQPITSKSGSAAAAIKSRSAIMGRIIKHQGAIMIQRPVLTEDDVQRIGDAAVVEAKKNGWNVSIAICDEGGHLLWLKRLDGAPAISAYIAPQKAKTAAMGRRESKIYEEVINQGRTSFLSVPELQAMLEGGVPIVVEGHCIGAVGVSAVKSSEDAQIAKAGIAAL
jgi:glc operon protein GlcG